MSFFPMKKKTIDNNTIDNETTWSSSQIIDMIYPIGCIFISTSSVNPSTYLNGTWEAFGTGKTLVGIDISDTSFNTVEKTGGEKTHTLTVAEMPSHAHTQVWKRTDGSDVTGGRHFLDPGGNYTSVTTGSAGGNGAHNNLQPYIVVYMWKRTA